MKIRQRQVFVGIVGVALGLAVFAAVAMLVDSPSSPLVEEGKVSAVVDWVITFDEETGLKREVANVTFRTEHDTCPILDFDQRPIRVQYGIRISLALNNQGQPVIVATSTMPVELVKLLAAEKEEILAACRRP